MVSELLNLTRLTAANLLCVDIARAMPLNSYFYPFTIKALDFQSMSCIFFVKLLLSLTLILTTGAPHAKLASVTFGVRSGIQILLREKRSLLMGTNFDWRKFC